MKPKNIRVAATEEGDLEASFGLGVTTKWVLMDRRTGRVIDTNVKRGSDAFRWLVNAARVHVAL